LRFCSRGLQQTKRTLFEGMLAGIFMRRPPPAPKAPAPSPQRSGARLGPRPSPRPRPSPLPRPRLLARPRGRSSSKARSAEGVNLPKAALAGLARSASPQPRLRLCGVTAANAAWRSCSRRSCRSRSCSIWCWHSWSWSSLSSSSAARLRNLHGFSDSDFES